MASAKKLPLPVEWQVRPLSYGGARWQHRQEEGDDVYDRPFPKDSDLEWYLADRYGWKFAKKVLAALKTSTGEPVGERKKNPKDVVYVAEVESDRFRVHVKGHPHNNSGWIKYNSHSELIRSQTEAKREAAAFIKQVKAGVLPLKNPLNIPVRLLQMAITQQANPTKRIKVKNAYMDLVIKGSATRVADGWKIGKKVFPWGKGTMQIKPHVFLDRFTGFYYVKKERNMTTSKKKPTKKRAAKKRKNIAGFIDETGFHPIRSGMEMSSSGKLRKSKRKYKPKAVGEKRTYAKKRKPAKKKASKKKAVKTVKSRKAAPSKKRAPAKRRNPGTCPTCTKPADQPYRQYDTRGKCVAGCIDDFHTGHLITPSESAFWHYRPQAKKWRAAQKKRMREMLKGAPRSKKAKNPRQRKIKRRAIGSVWVESRAASGGKNKYVVLLSTSTNRDLGEHMAEAYDKKQAEWEARMLRKQIKSGRVKVNPSAASIRKKFAGRHTKDVNLYFPDSTPKGQLAKLGKLIAIKLRGGQNIVLKNTAGEVWLCADTRERLHLGSTINAPLFAGPARDLGEVKEVEYLEAKPHLGFNKKVIWFHKMGEEGGARPRLLVNSKGELKFSGGDYRISARGIEN